MIWWTGISDRYDTVKNLWTMRHRGKEDFFATSQASKSSLLLGSHTWQVFNDSESCSSNKVSYETRLTLHACDPAEQFACGNAFCIDMERRCDGKVDCRDASDEQDCGILVLEPGYNMMLTPAPLDGSADLLVNISLNLLDILDINELEEVFKVKIAMKREWFDSRLSFKHLKEEDSNRNDLPEAEGESIWYPFLVFNVKDIEDIKNTEVPDVLEVIPNDEFTYLAEDNMHIFEGSKNALSLTKENNVEWKCEYEYHWYPFDTQVCRMEMLSFRVRTDIHPSRLQHNRNISLDRYTLSRIRMCKSTILNMRAIVVEVTLGRPIISTFLTVFVPTMLLLIISFTARFFAEDYIDMVIQVNLTILLVLATM